MKGGELVDPGDGRRTVGILGPPSGVPLRQDIACRSIARVLGA